MLQLVRPTLRDSLQSLFGYSTFRPGQEEVVRLLLQGGPVLAVMPTGGGKSLCYQLPAYLLPGTALVISPLVALMKDQVDGVAVRGLPGCTFINSSLPFDEQRSRLYDLQNGACRLVYLAPERFRNAAFMEAIARVPVSLIAIDEAHCISQWGHDFRPDYLHLKSVLQSLPEVPVLCLTASATPRVQDDIVRQTGLKGVHRVATGFDRPNLCFEVVRVDRARTRDAFLLEQVRSFDPPGIVYAPTRRECERLGALLQESGRLVVVYHAGLEPEVRSRIQDGFMSGDFQVIVATNAFGMGVDKADIRWVLHAQMPGDLESYYQEAGRAGRDGRPARCILLSRPGDEGLHTWFMQQEFPTIDELRKVLRQLTAPVGLEELQARVGLHPLKLRSALGELERHQVVNRVEARGGVSSVRVMKPLDRVLEWKIATALKERRKVKEGRLAAMLTYSGRIRCRRNYLLDYFGDGSSRDKRFPCCDLCGGQRLSPIA